jgi:hypothetical protein
MIIAAASLLDHTAQKCVIYNLEKNLELRGTEPNEQRGTENHVPPAVLSVNLARPKEDKQAARSYFENSNDGTRRRVCPLTNGLIEPKIETFSMSTGQNLGYSAESDRDIILSTPCSPRWDGSFLKQQHACTYAQEAAPSTSRLLAGTAEEEDRIVRSRLVKSRSSNVLKSSKSEASLCRDIAGK